MKLNLKKTVNNLLIGAIMLTAFQNVLAQEKILKEFKIIIEKTNDGIKMNSLNGSAWIDLKFNINNNQVVAIDEFGMTKLNKVSTLKNQNLTSFLFTITKTNKGILLKGIEGTKWTGLSFELIENGRKAINQFGMTNL